MHRALPLLITSLQMKCKGEKNSLPSVEATKFHYWNGISTGRVYSTVTYLPCAGPAVLDIDADGATMEGDNPACEVATFAVSPGVAQSGSP